MKKIFVTGATSMIGVAFLETCIKQGIEMYILIRKDSKNNERLPIESSYIHYVYGDIENLDKLSLEGDFDSCYHFAWLGTDKIQRNSTEIQSKNIQITLELIKFAKKHGCQKFIGAGSQAEYGVVEGVITEETLYNPQTAYGISKLCAGKLGETLCKELEISFVWGRVFSVYGKFDNSFAMIPQCIDHLLNKKEYHLSACTQTWNYLYSQDCGEIFYLLGSTSNCSGFYNVAHPDSQELKAYLNTIAEIIKGSPYLKFGTQAGLGICPNVFKLQKDTGWKPQIKFEDGIKRILQSGDFL